MKKCLLLLVMMVSFSLTYAQDTTKKKLGSVLGTIGLKPNPQS